MHYYVLLSLPFGQIGLYHRGSHPLGEPGRQELWTKLTQILPPQAMKQMPVGFGHREIIFGAVMEVPADVAATLPEAAWGPQNNDRRYMRRYRLSDGTEVVGNAMTGVLEDGSSIPEDAVTLGAVE